MNRDPVSCSKCGLKAVYNRHSCPSGHFVSFPNVRFAASMEPALIANYQFAMNASSNNGTSDKLSILYNMLSNSVATINISPKVFRNISNGTYYSSYYVAMSEGLREIAKFDYHSHRRSVDSKIHTGYEDQIINAQLSVTNRGLPSYDKITIILKDVAIMDRASVLRENAFLFYERHNLGASGVEEEAGWRSVWSNRAMLGIAHLGPSVTPATPVDRLGELVSAPGVDRQSDKFIEVHIFGQIDWQAIASAVLEAPAASPEDLGDWEFANQKLSTRGVFCSDLSS